MIKNYTLFITVSLLLFTSFLYSQQRNLWSKTDEAKIGISQLQRKVIQKKYQAFDLRVDQMVYALQSAPSVKSKLKNSSLKIAFPNEKGNLVTYLIKEAPVMHPALARKFPNNKSYVGVSANDPSIKIRFSLNSIGLHAIIMKGNKIQYIDPISSDKKSYKIYDRAEMESSVPFDCFTNNVISQFKSGQALKSINDGKLRTFRLALAATGEYSQYHIDLQGASGGTDDQKKDVVLSAMTTAMTRVNAVYENDLAVSFELVPNNEDIIFLDPVTDPYTNNEGSEMLDENQTTCDDVIGDANYDIGHVFSTGGGGVASLASVCNTGGKARGVTGSSQPVGESYYFDFVAHEMGHQLGANHSFNGSEENCGDGNRNDATAVEPGSGSTLMAYAGLCGSQNIQGQSDLYFHVISMDEIWTNLTAGDGTCATVTDLVLNNNVPVANAGDDFTIPIGTAYVLRGEGSDADGDPVTFSWEQVDNELTAVPPSSTSTSGALYRSVNPSGSSDRYLPSLNTLVKGVVTSKWEVTPDVAREMNFRLTVRDNNSEAGQIASDDLKVSVTDAAGPFLVTSQNIEEIVWTSSTQETISWDVAGTDGNGVDVTEVNILLSTDGGRNFDVVLAESVPNDGTQIITVPDGNAPHCFVMVEAAGNHFFSMNTESFSIGSFNEVCDVITVIGAPLGLAIPDNNLQGVTSTIAVSENVTIEKISLSIMDLTNPSMSSPGISHAYLGDLAITLESPEGTVVRILNRACDVQEDIEAVFMDSGDPLVCASPLTGKIQPEEPFSIFNGENAQGNWTLKIVDNEEADFGFLEAWSIEICSSEPVLAVNNYVFQDFKIFPNPSNGMFTVKFRSEDTGDVEITLYDLLGRKVTHHNYKSQLNNFEEQMNMTQLAGGIYILRVKRGNKFSSQKIRIN